MDRARLSDKNIMTSLAVLQKNKHRISTEERFPIIVAAREKSILETEILAGGIEKIEKIFDEWTILCEEGASNEPFLRPEWFASFVKNFEKEILLLTVRRGGRLRAVLPLMRKKATLHGVPVKKLQAVFNLQTQRFDLIHGADETERKEIVHAIWTEIKKLSGWQVLEMRLVKKNSWLKDLLDVATSEKFANGIWQMDSAPFIALQTGDDREKLIEEFFKGSRKHLKQELNRRLRRLKELGAVEFVVSHDYSPELMDVYLQLEADGWKGRGGTAATCDPKVTKLHNDFAREVAARNALSIYQLKLDGKTIAMSVNIRYDRQTVHWKTSYDEKYSRYSPGNLLFRELVSDCLRQNSPEIDFLSPATPNKRFWASGEREHAAFYVFQKSVFGAALAKWKFSVISRLRNFKKNKPDVKTIVNQTK